VIDVATLSVIRRWALREQMSIREIARRTGLSRNTVKKYLRAGEEMPRYAKRTSSSKLDPYAEKLATWLAIEATKSRKQRRNLRQIHTRPSSTIGSKSAARRCGRRLPTGSYQALSRMSGLRRNPS
jgi:transposase